MDTSTDTILRVGTMLEFRKSRRSMNRISLAKLAQKLFAVGPGDIIYLGSESALERAEVACHTEDSVFAG
jgi:hypothetical protein